MSLITISPASISDRKEILGDIQRRDCNLAVWQRPVPVDVNALLEGEPKDVRFQASAANLEPALRGELDKSGLADCIEREELIEDVLQLSRLFHELLPSPSLEIRLEVVTGNACWKFHRDYVEMRLISTYSGRGTQWIDEPDAERLANGQKPQSINELALGDVGLFKGRLGTDQPVIHRSPPIEGTGETRLLLVINPIDDEE